MEIRKFDRSRFIRKVYTLGFKSGKRDRFYSKIWKVYVHFPNLQTCRLGNFTLGIQSRPRRSLFDQSLASTRLKYNCAHLRSTKEKKEENIWRRKIFFADGMINGGGKGG